MGLERPAVSIMGADLCAVYDLIFRADCDWNSFGRDIDILDLWGKTAGFPYSLIFPSEKTAI